MSIRINDLPLLQDLTPAQLKHLFGAGSFKPRFEQLEDRLVPASINFVQATGVLTITGNNYQDAAFVRLIQEDGNQKLKVDLYSAENATAWQNAWNEFEPSDEDQSLRDTYDDALDCADDINHENEIHVIKADGGHDDKNSLDLSKVKQIVFEGNAGNDEFRLTAQDGTFTNLTVLGTPTGPGIVFRGGSGDDLFQNLSASSSEAHGGAGLDSLLGGTGTDSLYGEDDSDILHGGAGRDTLEGGVGDDFLYGEEGVDDLHGGAGRDYLEGGADNDFLYGDADNDELHGGAGIDTLDGGAGVDTLYGDGETDYLYGGTEGDTLDGGTGDDWLYGDAGVDTLRGGTGVDRLYGGADMDYLYGGADRDFLYGEAGDDYLLGEAGNDDLYGGDGQDYLYGGVGADRLDGGLDAYTDFLYGNNAANDPDGSIDSFVESGNWSYTRLGWVWSYSAIPDVYRGGFGSRDADVMIRPDRPRYTI